MKTKNNVLAIASFIVILLTHPLQGMPDAQSEQTHLSSDQLIAVCSPERLFPHVGEPIDLHAYAAEQKESMFSYAWTATRGAK
jgi:hypothetical protein